jgi:Arc/MetJ-type ribon-helix-helix transcriptional regulator
MTIHLTPEQESRMQAVIRRGSYQTIDEVLEAALAAVEQHTVPAFDGTAGEMEAMLAEGLVSKELTEGEFWESVNTRGQTPCWLSVSPAGIREGFLPRYTGCCNANR